MIDYVVEFGKDGGPVEPDGRLDAAAFHRNQQPIRAALAPYLNGRSGDAFEAGSGTGQHVIEFARDHPGVVWWPSDLNPQHLRSIAAWRAHARLDNVRAPLPIDLADPDWSIAPDGGEGPDALLAMFCANVVHIAPWPVAQGLFAGAGRLLAAHGHLFLYGPFKRDGHHTALSNAVFDTSLRAANADWGVRDVAEMTALGAEHGLALRDIVEMPANNLIVVLSRAERP